MQPPKKYISTKEWLQSVKHIDKEIKSLRYEQNRLLSKGLVSSPYAVKSLDSLYTNLNETRFIEYTHYSDIIGNKIKELYTLKEDVHNAIEGISNDISRILLRERYINGKSFLEIATLLGLSYDYVIGDLHPAALRAVKVPDKYI